MDKKQEFTMPKNFDSCLEEEQVIKEFTNQERNNASLDFVYIPWDHQKTAEEIEDDINQVKRYIAVEDHVNYHITLMLRFLGGGGSNFQLECLCYQSNICTLFAH